MFSMLSNDRLVSTSMSPVISSQGARNRPPGAFSMPTPTMSPLVSGDTGVSHLGSQPTMLTMPSAMNAPSIAHNISTIQSCKSPTITNTTTQNSDANQRFTSLFRSPVFSLNVPFATSVPSPMQSLTRPAGSKSGKTISSVSFSPSNMLMGSPAVGISPTNIGSTDKSSVSFVSAPPLGLGPVRRDSSVLERFKRFFERHRHEPALPDQIDDEHTHDNFNNDNEADRIGPENNILFDQHIVSHDDSFKLLKTETRDMCRPTTTAASSSSSSSSSSSPHMSSASLVSHPQPDDATITNSTKSCILLVPPEPDHSSGTDSGSSETYPVNLDGVRSTTHTGSRQGSSCHQCKSRRMHTELSFCVPALPKGRKSCRKKYCLSCLAKFYSKNPPKQKAHRQMPWTCPSCEGLCCCAACRRSKEKKDFDLRRHGYSGTQVMSPATSMAVGMVYFGDTIDDEPPSAIRDAVILARSQLQQEYDMKKNHALVTDIDAPDSKRARLHE